MVFFMSFLFEALTLGFASGFACLASCGVVLLPWLTALRRGWRGTLFLLGLFLSGRLAGYLIVGCIAGWLGNLAHLRGPGGLLLCGVADLFAAALLGLQAWKGLAGLGTSHKPCPVGQSLTFERRFGLLGLALLGLFTGLNICGPFVTAALRAAQTGGPGPATAFFACFFVGTAVWMLPLIAVGGLRRWTPPALVSHLVLAALALIYACTGILLLLRWHHA